MQLSILILNYNVSHLLDLCLQSVEQAVDGMDAQIIVVDNASSDDSWDMLQRKYNQHTIIQAGENLGFAAGNNRGVQSASGEWLLILNPDTIVSASALKTLLDQAAQIKNLGAIGPRLIDGTGNFHPESKRNLPTPAVALHRFTGLGKTPYYATHIAERETAPVDILVGACMLMRTQVYRAVGGFDERYFMYAEDIDLSYTLLQAGLQNQYCGAATVIHFKGESARKDWTYRKRFYGTMRQFYAKHAENGTEIQTLNSDFDFSLEDEVEKDSLSRKRKTHKSTIDSEHHIEQSEPEQKHATRTASRSDTAIQSAAFDFQKQNTKELLVTGPAQSLRYFSNPFKQNWLTGLSVNLGTRLLEVLPLSATEEAASDFDHVNLYTTHPERWETLDSISLLHSNLLNEVNPERGRLLLLDTNSYSYDEVIDFVGRCAHTESIGIGYATSTSEPIICSAGKAGRVWIMRDNRDNVVG